MRWFIAGIVAGAGICILIEKTVPRPDWPVSSSGNSGSNRKGKA